MQISDEFHRLKIPRNTSLTAREIWERVCDCTLSPAARTVVSQNISNPFFLGVVVGLGLMGLANSCPHCPQNFEPSC
jgi:hypothetical protein